VCATAAWAAQQSNTAKYRSTAKYKGKPSKKHPRNAFYTAILDIGTTDGKQPNTAPLTELFFAKELKNNGSKFKACPPADIDGKGTITPRCKKAQIGGGKANALFGAPGSSTSLPQDLTVLAFNGPKGKSLLLALTGGALGQSYRVIPGKRKALKGKFGFKLGFRVPKELQGQLGSQIALTHFNVKVKTKKTVRIKGKRASYLQVQNCPKSRRLPVKVVVHFNDDAGNPTSQTKTDTSKMKCHR
jgi:hypothetical protein